MRFSGAWLHTILSFGFPILFVEYVARRNFFGGICFSHVVQMCSGHFFVCVSLHVFNLKLKVYQGGIVSETCLFYNPSKLPLNLQELTSRRVQTLPGGFAQKCHKIYISQFTQIFFAIWTNQFCKLNKYILQFGQINFAN